MAHLKFYISSDAEGVASYVPLLYFLPLRIVMKTKRPVKIPHYKYIPAQTKNRINLTNKILLKRRQYPNIHSIVEFTVT